MYRPIFVQLCVPDYRLFCSYSPRRLKNGAPVLTGFGGLTRTFALIRNMGLLQTLRESVSQEEILGGISPLHSLA